MSGNGTAAFNPPVPIATDYVEASILIALILVGTPLNIKTAIQLHASRKRETTGRAPALAKLAFIQLKIHLNFSDLLILFVYGVGRVVWLFTYEWLACDFMCKALNFSNMFIYCASSNIITAIALDRLHTVSTMDKPAGDSTMKVTKCLLIGAWGAAAICGFPQIFVWEKFSPVPNIDWSQCTDKFSSTLYAADPNRSDIKQFTQRIESMKKLYSGATTMTLFWIPLLITAFCYSLIFQKLMNHSGKWSGRNSENGNLSPRSGSTQSYRNGSQKIKELEMSESTYLMTPTRTNGGSVGKTSLVRKESRIRHQFRSKVFRATLSVVLAHVALWLPYNCTTIIRIINPGATWLEWMDFSNCLIALNAVINPLLYELKD